MSVFEQDGIKVIRGDSLAVLRSLPDASVDAVISDPPYSSGGMFRSDRAVSSTTAKYTLTGTAKSYPDFHGDNRDQRSFGYWMALWLAEALRVTRRGGYLMIFTDWRQLPTSTDAVQAGGWIWRGIVPWDKTEASRPQLGWFRAQCEYVITASKGSMGKEQERLVPVCAPGVFKASVLSEEKYHTTGKPVKLMRDLMQVLPPGSTILDPFAGGGSTLLAARDLGHKAIGIELSSDYFQTIQQRLQESYQPALI